MREYPSAEAEERKDGDDDHDEANEIDDGVHGCLSGFKCFLTHAPLSRFRPRAGSELLELREGRTDLLLAGRRGPD